MFHELHQWIKLLFLVVLRSIRYQPQLDKEPQCLSQGKSLLGPISELLTIPHMQSQLTPVVAGLYFFALNLFLPGQLAGEL